MRSSMPTRPIASAGGTVIPPASAWRRRTRAGAFFPTPTPVSATEYREVFFNLALTNSAQAEDEQRPVVVPCGKPSYNPCTVCCRREDLDDDGSPGFRPVWIGRHG